jgi:hypothetical protein
MAQYREDMNDLHPTFPAKTGSAGVIVWVACALAVAGVVGAVWTLIAAA